MPDQLTSTLPSTQPYAADLRLQRQTNASTWRWLRLALIALELIIVALWTLNVTSEFRGTSKYELVSGTDYFVSVQGRFFWDHVRSCGSCSLWNGDVRGGAPSYIDANVDMFHPIVALPAYFFGALQGSKVSIVLAMFMGGLAVWWLALELGVGAIGRVVTACMAVASGSMLGRLEGGLVVLVTATAAAFLVLPALIRLSKHPNRRNAGLLGLILGLEIISGQGYIQIGLAILTPLVLLLIVGNPNGWKRTLGHFALAGILGLLVSMIFVYPFVRNYGDLSKVGDVTFGALQPMKYQILNLVIDDYDFQSSTFLGKAGIAAWYVNYIGWIPIAFALVGVGLLWRRSKRMTLFLGLSFLGALWIGSGSPFRLLAKADFISEELKYFAWSVRYPSFVSSLAIPPLLGFAAVAIDAAFRAIVNVPDLELRSVRNRVPLDRIATVAVRLAVAGLLALSLRDLHHFARNWIWTDAADPTHVQEFVDLLATDDLAWVSPMRNSTPLQVLGTDAGLKWSDSWRSWKFEGLDNPEPYLSVQDQATREGMTLIGPWGTDFLLESVSGNQYVTAPVGGGCRSSGEGGHLDFECTLPEGGAIVVQELDRGYWEATVNGVTMPVSKSGQWISVEAPAGDSLIELRYRPTDFWIGASLSVIGVLACIVFIALPSRYHFEIEWKRPKSTRSSSKTVG